MNSLIGLFYVLNQLPMLFRCSPSVSFLGRADIFSYLDMLMFSLFLYGLFSGIDTSDFRSSAGNYCQTICSVTSV